MINLDYRRFIKCYQRAERTDRRAVAIGYANVRSGRFWSKENSTNPLVSIAACERVKKVYIACVICVGYCDFKMEFPGWSETGKFFDHMTFLNTCIQLVCVQISICWSHPRVGCVHVNVIRRIRSCVIEFRNKPLRATDIYYKVGSYYGGSSSYFERQWLV